MDLVPRFLVRSRHRADAISGLDKALPRAKSVSIRRVRSGRLCARAIGLPGLPASNHPGSNLEGPNGHLIAVGTSAKAVRSVDPAPPVPGRRVPDHLVQGRPAVTVPEGVHRARPSGRSENARSDRTAERSLRSRLSNSNKSF
jgi:hypothetical protein